MKKKMTTGKGFTLILMLCVATLMPLFVQSVQAPLTWNIETVDSTGDVGYFLSIALDSTDKTHISYYDSSYKNLKYALWNGTDWNIEAVDSLGIVGSWTSIALDSSDCPHISYSAWTTRSLRYARWNGIDWNIETVDSAGLGYQTLSHTSLALDSGDYPHISYYDETNRDLKYARWNGIDWNIETVDSAGDVGDYTSIALDSGDHPHISYRGGSSLKYARWNETVWNGTAWTGPGWSIETVDSTGGVGQFSSIALDSGDHPHISYRRDFLGYARWNGTDWNIETVDSTGNVGSYTSIALDSSDCPHISYYDHTNHDLKYARWTGSAWSIETVDSEGVVGQFTSVALDSGDYPHISYQDVLNQDLKYATSRASDYELAVSSFPVTGISFTIDGEIHSTPCAKRLPEGFYKIEMPEIHDEYVWSHWLEDGDTNRIKTVTLSTDITLTAVFLPAATIDIDPDTLNLRSGGQWITCYIELPEDYDVGAIDVSTIMLDDTIPVFLLDVPAPHPVPTEIGDYDEDGIPDLMVKFDRASVQSLISYEGIRYGDVVLTITGALVDGTPFEGTDVIFVNYAGDVDNNGVVNVFDIIAIKAHWYPGPPTGPFGYNSNADLDNNGQVDVFDIMILKVNFGETVP